jgi:hypothetical protein
MQIWRGMRLYSTFVKWYRPQWYLRRRWTGDGLGVMPMHLPPNVLD